MFELLGIVIMCAFGGYTIGRTLTQEAFLEVWMKKIVDSTVAQDDPSKGIYVYEDLGTGEFEIIRRIEPEDPNGSAELIVISDKPYRMSKSDNKHAQMLTKPFRILWYKVGELLSCIFCLSAQTGLQLAFWTLAPFGFIPIWVLAVLAVPALTYIINDNWKPD